jgi:opacity protein-like surface antigen
MRLSSVTRGAALAGLFLATGFAAALAQDDGYGYLPYPGDGEGNSGLYAGLRGSMAFRGKDGATTVPPAATALRGSHDTGYGGALVLGAHLPYGFKAEAEGLFRHRPYETMTLGGTTTTASGFRDTGAVMGNLLWEVPLAEYAGLPIRPFIGGGAGMAYTRSRLNDNPAGANTYLQASGWRFAYQGLAGFKVDVAPGARMTAMYRYFQTDNIRSRCGTTGAPTQTCVTPKTVDQGVDVGLELDL